MLPLLCNDMQVFIFSVFFPPLSLLIQFARPVFSCSAALGWFAYAPEYYESTNKSFAQREAQSVSIFVHSLQNERATSSTDSGKSQGREGELNTV